MIKIVSADVSRRVGEKLMRVINEEFELAKTTGRNEKASILAGALLSLLSLIEGCGPFKPGSLAIVELAAKECLGELVSVSVDMAVHPPTDEELRAAGVRREQLPTS